MVDHERVREILSGVRVNVKIIDGKIKKWINVLKIIKLPNKRKKFFKVLSTEGFKILKQKDVDFLVENCGINFLIKED